jgi:formiminotetrahydrofolate cyclodeaminase
MKFNKSAVVLGLALALAGGVVMADHHGEKKTRVGTCADAKKQQDYFCDMKNAASDSMVALGTACRNAKINVKEACDGVVDKDEAYKSCKMEQKC